MKNTCSKRHAVFLSACAAGIFFYTAAGIACAAPEPQTAEHSGLRLPLEIVLLIGLCLLCIVGWSLVLRRELRVALKGLELRGEQLLEVRQSVARMEKSTTSLDALLHGILDAIPDIIFFKDAQGRYKLCNHAFAAYTGYPEEEILGKNDAELFARLVDDPEFFNTMDRRAIEQGGPSVNEEELTYPDGTKRLMETIKTPYFSDGGELVGLIGIARDITERKKTEDNLRQARREAEQASQAKSDFLANMSHEIRTPMNGILGLCYLACRKECSPELREYLLKIEGSAKRLMGVINDILDFSKIEAGRMTIERTRFRLRDIVENVLTLLRPGAEAKGVELCCETASGLPEHFWGDPLRVQQILLNLGGNAVKFTASGGVLLSFSWLQKEGRGAVEIAVEDTGIGMDEASLGRLFLPFSQADTSTTRRYGGTGLGLAISRDFVELMGGTITVAGKIGRGALFVVRLPLSVADPSNTPTAGSATVSGTDAADAAVPAEALRGLRILLAEDNSINQFIIREILEEKGARVDIASNGREAASCASKNAYDAILMDIQMPEMGGIESAQLLRKKRALDATPIIALSACALQREQRESLAAGMQAHLTKPVDPEQLCAVLVKWVDICRRSDSASGREDQYRSGTLCGGTTASPPSSSNS